MPGRRWLFILLAPTAAILTALLGYYPGLDGGFVFDDHANIVSNDDVRIESLGPIELWRSASSGRSGPLGRPLAMLSFGLNTYFSGMDAWAMKLTNVLLHGVNATFVGILAYLLLNALLAPQASRGWRLGIALFTAAAWLLHPLNLTSVLYVVQRMTSLATLAMLLGIIGYVHARTRMISGRTGWALLITATVLALMLGLASKETAALLPVYLLVCELAVFRFAGRTRTRYGLFAFYGLSLGLPALAILSYTLIDPEALFGAYQGRDFTLWGRLLTEARVILWYLGMILIPRTSELGLFLDDFAISLSLLDPMVTLPALIATATGVTTAFYGLRRAPVLGFAILWFLGGHLLESTVLPLEIAYEHRNYLPSFGIIFAVVYYVTLAFRYFGSSRLGWLVMFAWLAVLAFGLHVRAYEWGEPRRHYSMEVQHHPKSPRAHFYAGSMYGTLAAQTDGPVMRVEYFMRAREHFSKAIELDPDMASAQFGTFYLYQDVGIAPYPASQWVRLVETVAEAPTTASTVNAFRRLSQCLIAEKCSLAREDFETLLDAALDNPSLRSSYRALILAYAADYFGQALGDYAAAKRCALIAAEIQVTDIPYRLDLVKWSAMSGDLTAAESHLTRAEALDTLGLYSERLARWRKLLAQAVEQGKVLTIESDRPRSTVDRRSR